MPPSFTHQVIHRSTPAERVLCVVGDIDRDGSDEIIIGQRAPAPRLSWLGREADGTWHEHLIDDSFDHLEAGGFLFDIDGDGRLDFVAGADARGDQIWWWQCAVDLRDPNARWVRREIFRMPANQSHDQLVADLDGDGRGELYFWNQGSRTLFWARIPDDPTVTPWPNVKPLARDVSGEGLCVADVDGDGAPELIAGLCWYKLNENGSWESHQFVDGFVAPRLAAADFDADGRIEIALSEGDASLHGIKYGRLAMCKHGHDPRQPWKVQIIHDRLLDPHSLDVADFDSDGRPDLFVAELGDPNGNHAHLPALRIYFNREGTFEEQVIARTDFGAHEAQVIRIDGRTGVVGKPYRNLTSPTPRPPDVDAIHLWMVSGP